MTTLNITNKLEQENGTLVSYEILDGEVVLEEGERLVPTGFDRLLIPQTDGSPALYAYL